jgi:hypothetical protein
MINSSDGEKKCGTGEARKSKHHYSEINDLAAAWQNIFPRRAHTDAKYV